MTLARSAAALLGCLAIGACSFGGPPLSGQALANRQTLEACRQRANQVYDLQHRGEIYRPPPAIDTPYSGAFAPGGLNDRRLSELYTQNQLVNDCVRNTGTQTDRGRVPTLSNSR